MSAANGETAAAIAAEFYEELAEEGVPPNRQLERLLADLIGAALDERDAHCGRKQLPGGRTGVAAVAGGRGGERPGKPGVPSEW